MVEDGSFIVAVWFFDIDVLKQEGLEDGWSSFFDIGDWINCWSVIQIKST